MWLLNREASTAKRRPSPFTIPLNSAIDRSGSEEVPELVTLGAEVAGVLDVLRLHDGDALVHAQAVALEADHLARIVRDRPDRGQAEVEQDLRADAVVAQVGGETELFVRLDRVGAGVLQLVRLELVEQADASTFLIEVHDRAASLLLDHLHRRLELPAAIAAHRVE